MKIIGGLCTFIGICLLSGVTPENPNAGTQYIFAFVLFIIAAFTAAFDKSEQTGGDAL